MIHLQFFYCPTRKRELLQGSAARMVELEELQQEETEDRSAEPSAAEPSSAKTGPSQQRQTAPNVF
jgi:hypothetical protein